MTKKKSDGETVLLKSKLGFALGVLEAVQILTKQSTPEILEKNLEHLRLTIPRSIEDIKSGLIHFN
jgi:hypothetical protein